MIEHIDKNNEGMKPSIYCIRIGLSSLGEMVKLSGVSRQTLINWWNDPVKIRRFKCVAHGCVKVKNDPTITLEEV